MTMDHRNDAVEQWLKEHEARLTALEAESKKLDRLVYKLFKRLPRQTHEEESSPSREVA
jgi:hypothetical protein